MAAFIAFAPIPIGKMVSPRAVSIGGVQQDSPTLLLLGDSISLQYSSYLAKYLEACVDVHLLMRPVTQTVWQYMTSPVWKFANVEDSSKLKEKVAAWLGGSSFDIILVNVGIHDVRRDDGSFISGIDKVRYRTNIGAIINNLKKKASRVFFVLTSPVFDRSSGRPFHELVGPLNAIASEVSASLGVEVLPVPHGISIGELRYFDRDGVHLNSVGADYFGESIAVQIRSEVCQSSIDIELL